MQQGNQRINEFTMNIDITRIKIEEETRKPGRNRRQRVVRHGNDS